MVNQVCTNLSPDYQNNYAAKVTIRMQFFYFKPKQHGINFSTNNPQNSAPNALNPNYENCTAEFKVHTQAKLE